MTVSLYICPGLHPKNKSGSNDITNNVLKVTMINRNNSINVDFHLSYLVAKANCQISAVLPGRHG